MYRINIHNLDTGKDIKYKKYYNNDDFKIHLDNDKLKYYKLYVIYYIENNNIFPIKNTENVLSAKKFIENYKYNMIYIVGLKTNKIYKSIYDYEYLYINMK